MKQVEIFCRNTQTSHNYPLGTSLLEISRDLNIQTENTVCGAMVNHQVKELSFCVVKTKQIEFIDISHPDGIRMYIRSLLFVMYAAVKEVFATCYASGSTRNIKRLLLRIKRIGKRSFRFRYFFNKTGNEKPDS